MRSEEIGTICLVAVLALLAPVTAYGGEGAPSGPCKIAGIWIGSSPPFLPDLGDQALIFSETITPIDDTCQRYSTVLSPINPELTFGGLFPEAEAASDLYGMLLREDPDRYRLLLAATYFTAPPPAGLPIRGPVIYFWTYTGTVTCLDQACSEKIQEGTLSLYSNIDDPARVFPPLGISGVGDQDADDDGFADPGEVPIFAAPFPLASRRLTD